VQGADTGPSDTSPSPVWRRDDFTIPNWIYGSISLELLIMTTSPGASARQVWTAIYNLSVTTRRVAASPSMPSSTTLPMVT
jgi:hypothetical protein